VDDVSREAEQAARSAVAFLNETDSPGRPCEPSSLLPVLAGPGIRSVVPQLIARDRTPETIRLAFRPARVYRAASICLRDSQGQLVLKSRRRILTPGEESRLEIPAGHWPAVTAGHWQLSIEE